MAISGSFDWTATRNEIIKQALRKIGAVAIGSEPTTDQISEAAWELNALVQDLTTEGVHLWRVTELSPSLSASINELALDAETIGIEDIWIEYNDNTYPVELISKFQYADLIDRDATGRPEAAWLEMVHPPKLHFDRTTDIADYDLHYFQVKRLADFDSATDNPDLPDRWISTLVYLLAAQLSPNYKLPLDRQTSLWKIGQYLLKKAKGSTREQVDREFVDGCY